MKKCSHPMSSPVHGTRALHAQYFVVPPTFSAPSAPLSLLLREGDRARLRARSAGVFPVLLAVSTLSMAQDSVCLTAFASGPRAWQQETSAASCPAKPALVQAHCSRRLPTRTLSVRRCGRYCSGITAAGSAQTFRGVLGRTSSRQSRSPRARPWMSISAVAALVAKGTLCWSHRLVIYRIS